MTNLPLRFCLARELFALKKSIANVEGFQNVSAALDHAIDGVFELHSQESADKEHAD